MGLENFLAMCVCVRDALSQSTTGKGREEERWEISVGERGKETERE